MAKYILEAINDIETYVPAGVMEYRHLITGEVIDTQPVPEFRNTTKKGTRTICRNKKEVTKLLASGNWIFASMP